MKSDRSYKTITCIMPAGRGREVHNRLMREEGVLSATTHHARGVGAASLRRRRTFVAEEKDVLIVLVEEGHADTLFRFLYETARVGEPHVGLVFMSPTQLAFPMVTPLVEGEQKQ